jgi:hypothetical protein
MMKRLLGMIGFVMAIRSLIWQTRFESDDPQLWGSFVSFAVGMALYEWSRGIE